MRLFPEIRAYEQVGLFPTDAYGLSWATLSAVGEPRTAIKPLESGLFTPRDPRMEPSLPTGATLALDNWTWLELYAHARTAPIVQRVAVFHRSEVLGVKYGRGVYAENACNLSIIVELQAFDLELIRDGHVTMRPRDRELGTHGEAAILNPEQLLARRI